MPGKTRENQLYRWEHGHHRPGDDSLEALAGILDVDVSYFMSDDGDEESAPAPDPFESTVLREIKKLREEVREALEQRPPPPGPHEGQ